MSVWCAQYNQWIVVCASCKKWMGYLSIALGDCAKATQGFHVCAHGICREPRHIGAYMCVVRCVSCVWHTISPVWCAKRVMEVRSTNAAVSTTPGWLSLFHPTPQGLGRVTVHRIGVEEVQIVPCTFAHPGSFSEVSSFTLQIHVDFAFLCDISAFRLV